MAWCSIHVCLLLAWVGLCHGVVSRDAESERIKFAVNFPPDIEPPVISPAMHWTNRLFQIQAVQSAQDITIDIDAVGYTDLKSMVRCYGDSPFLLPSYLNSTQASEIFRDKYKWIEWMLRNDLGKYIQRVYNESDRNFVFPVRVVKSQLQPMEAATNVDELKAIQMKLKSSQIAYHIIEPLVASEMHTKISMWGSAYNGALLSLRCLTHEKGLAVTPTPIIELASLGKHAWVACSVEINSMVRSILAKSAHFGAFQVSALFNKLDGSVKVRRIELSYSQIESFQDALFMIMYVPFVYRLARAREGSTLAKILHQGPNRDVFQAIAMHEGRVLKTGGGLLSNTWIRDVPTFNASIIVDDIRLYFNEKILFSSMKVSVGVVGSELILALWRLPVARTLFTFHQEIWTNYVSKSTVLVLSNQPHHFSATLKESTAPHLILQRNDLSPCGHWQNQLLFAQELKKIGLEKFAVLPQHERSFTNSEGNNREDIERKQAGGIPTEMPAGYAYGSALRGTLLSLRCVKSISNARRMVACGTVLVTALQKLFEASSKGYTGLFCAKLALRKGSELQPLIVSVLAHTCSAVSTSDALFISTVVPLAVALHTSGLPDVASQGWLAARPAFAHIAHEENRTLHMGSSSGKEVVNFDPTQEEKYTGYYIPISK